MARWALSTQYGYDLKWEPAICTGIERQKDKIIITFNQEVKTPNEKGQPVDDKKRIEVWNNLTINPVEVRYAWARNPLGNLVNSAETGR